MPEIPTFLDDDVLRIGAIEFQCAFPLRNATGGRVPVMKERELVERYIELSQNLEPAVMVELGINRGGSTALLSELYHPDTLIAVEINTTPVPVLQEYIAEQGLTDVVRPFYGVDQSDRARVSEILAQELGGRPIDLVVDDASHLYDETLSSFETLSRTSVPTASSSSKTGASITDSPTVSPTRFIRRAFACRITSTITSGSS